jgi:release factor glutamine methyltransferase
MITSAIKGSVELLKILKQTLRETYDQREADNISLILIEYFFEISKTQILMDTPFTKFDHELLDNLNECLSRLSKHEPIQHILGETEFYGLPFYVNKSVLIPRQETEELVDWILRDNESVDNLRLLDLGTGSGCIPISIKKEKENTYIEAIELSEDALSVAKDNAELNQVDIVWIKNNILDLTHNTDIPFDVIVSNPPYITNAEKKSMDKNVLEFDPHLALFVENETPLVFYEKIADYAIHQLTNRGALYFEINEHLGKEMINLLEEKNFTSIELRQDLNGRDRMIKALKK